MNVPDVFAHSCGDREKTPLSPCLHSLLILLAVSLQLLSNYPLFVFGIDSRSVSAKRLEQKQDRQIQQFGKALSS